MSKRGEIQVRIKGLRDYLLHLNYTESLTELPSVCEERQLQEMTQKKVKVILFSGQVSLVKLFETAEPSVKLCLGAVDRWESF